MRGAAGSGRRARLQGDKASAALKRQVSPGPARGDDEAVAQANQEVDVGDAPHQPTEEAGQLDAPDLYHRRLSPDRREIALMMIDEGRHDLACDVRADGVSGVL